MKTKRKEKEKKKERKEAKTHRAKALPLGHVELTWKIVEILLLNPSSLIKREFKDILQFRQ